MRRAEPSGAQRPGDSDALRYWYLQEEVPLPDPAPMQDAERGQMPGGWWIVPAFALSVVIWGVLAIILL